MGERSPPAASPPPVASPRVTDALPRRRPRADGVGAPGSTFVRERRGQRSWRACCTLCSASWPAASVRAASALASCSATSRWASALSCWARPSSSRPSLPDTLPTTSLALPLTSSTMPSAPCLAPLSLLMSTSMWCHARSSTGRRPYLMTVETYAWREQLLRVGPFGLRPAVAHLTDDPFSGLDRRFVLLGGGIDHEPRGRWSNGIGRLARHADDGRGRFRRVLLVAHAARLPNM